MRKRLSIILVAAVSAALFVTAAGYAAGTPSDGLVHSCYKASGVGQGAMFRVDQGVSCPSGFTALSWPAHGLGHPFDVNAQFSIPADAGQHQFTLDCGGGPNFALSADGQVWVSQPPIGQHFLPVLTIKSSSGLYFFIADGDQPGGPERTLDAHVVCAPYL